MSQAEQNEKVAAQPSRARIFKWVAAIFFVVLAVVSVMNLPRGYSDDLSPIGKGKVAVVLIRDKNAVQTFELMDAMNEIRDEYSDRVEFLLTDFNTPQGRAFMAAHGAPRVTVVVLDAKGKMVNILSTPLSGEHLKHEISMALQGAS